MREEELNLKKFDPKTILPDATILCLGSRRTGKSFLIRDLLYHHRTIPIGICMSGTESANPFFGDFIPDSYIYSEFDPVLLTNIYHKQQRKINRNRKAGVGDNGKTPANNLFLILDDMMNSADIWKRDETIKTVFYNGRHYNIMCIISSQYINILPPGIRQNFDYVFVFDEPSIQNRRKIYESFFGAIPSFDLFCNILDECTEDFGCLVSTKNKERGLENKIFWYRAKNHSDFKMCHPKVWEYHKGNYNKEYEDALEKKLAHADKIKNKYKNSKKLKVIVSKENDIIGYDETSF
jgi:hypothetical protein